MFGLSPKKIIVIVLVIVGGFALSQYVPAYVTRYQLSDGVRELVKYAAASRKDTEAVRREVVKQADDLGIEINPKQIQIVKRGPSFTLEFNYVWPINLRVYQHELKFEISASGEVFEK